MANFNVLVKLGALKYLPWRANSTPRTLCYNRIGFRYQTKFLTPVETVSVDLDSIYKALKCPSRRFHHWSDVRLPFVLQVIFL